MVSIAEQAHKVKVNKMWTLTRVKPYKLKNKYKLKKVKNNKIYQII